MVSDINGFLKNTSIWCSYFNNTAYIFHNQDNSGKNKIIDFLESAERFLATCTYSLLRFPLPPHPLPLLFAVLEMKPRIMCLLQVSRH